MTAIPFSLNASQIIAGMNGTPSIAVEVVNSTGSTNADLLQRCTLLDQPTALIAIEQTAGRGRAGRSWLSPVGQSLTFSLAWPCFAATPAQLAGLSLATGVVTAEAMNQFMADTGIHADTVRLKWPNDILQHDAKLAGILIESRQVAHCLWVVIGIGLNVHDVHDDTESAASLSDLIGRDVASLPLSVSTASAIATPREKLLAVLLSGLTNLLPQFLKSGLLPFHERWQQLHAWQGRAVTLAGSDQTGCDGIALGIDQQGALLIEKPDGSVTTFQVGDMSLHTR